MSTKILVIDDDTNICELLKLYFENEGYSVKIANDGVEGLNYFKIYEPDMVLLLKYKVGIPKIILFSAGMGIVLYGILGLPVTLG